MRITIVYDNKVWKDNLKADWGFSCLIEVYGKNIAEIKTLYPDRFVEGGAGKIIQI
jgi:hypothetical protein